MVLKRYVNKAVNPKKGITAMAKKKILNPNRLRRIDGGFSYIPHRFLTDGFLASLNQKELLLYLFLILVSDRHGLSFYSYDSICSLLQITDGQYIDARNALIKKDLIAFDGTLFQVLNLPTQPLQTSTSERLHPDKDQNEIKQIIQQSLWGDRDGR